MFLIRNAATLPEGRDTPELEDDHALYLDICGQLCPSTLLTALRAVNERQEALRSGVVSLRLKTDNRDAITTIPEAVRHMGYEVSVTKQAGYYLVEVVAPGRHNPPRR